MTRAPPAAVRAGRDHGAIPRRRSARLRVGADVLDADVAPPTFGRGTVIFADGTGSSRSSARHQYLADVLEGAGLGTVLLDLWTEAEEETDLATTEYRFNLPLLTTRLEGATDWVRAQPSGRSARLGYFGTGTGGAAAMIAASRRAPHIAAMVLRGARTDLAASVAPHLTVPTLLLVGGLDPATREANEGTLRLLPGPHRLDVIPAATHLFAESGALEAVAAAAVRWFVQYLGPTPP